jgi:hypothetical protein
MAKEKATILEPDFVTETTKPVTIGLEAFASSKSLHWTVKTRLIHYAEQNKVGEVTVEEWESILAIL